ncbi:MAG: hypothetical protein ACK5WZ_14335 [Pseudobdellovibrionaceae bacterium]
MQRSSKAFLFIVLIFALASFFGISKTFAAGFQSATSVGTAGTGRAAIEPIDVISLNPAGLPHLLGRHFSISTQKNALSVAISDNTKESMIPGGIAYVQRRLGEAPDINSQDFRLSLGEFFKDKWAVGLSAHYLDIKTEGKVYNQLNGDLGITYTRNANLGFALVGSDLAPVNKDLPESFQNQAKLGFGSYWIYKSFFRIRGDLISNLTKDSGKLTYAVGAESYVESWFVFRSGLARDELNEEAWGSLGLGFLGPRFYINYAWEKTVASNNLVEDRNFHSVDLGIPF